MLLFYALVLVLIFVPAGLAWWRAFHLLVRRDLSYLGGYKNATPEQIPRIRVALGALLFLLGFMLAAIPFATLRYNLPLNAVGGLIAVVVGVGLLGKKIIARAYVEE
jgi:hypothetical protein